MKTINFFRSKLFALTLVLMASVSTFAYEFEYVNDFHVDGFAYKVLPPTMEAPFGNVALIEIADCTEDVVIPGTVTHEGVTYIVTTLGGGATLFTNSAKEIVKSVFIPKKISTINSPLFADCSNLTSIVVDSRNSYYDSRENCNAIITTSQNSFFTPNMLIAGCKTTTIPNSVTEIADKAFYRSAIESITIPTGVTKIGHSAFNQATLLSSIKLPITLTEIGDWAFADCLSLNTISCYALEPPTISSNTFFGSNPIYNNPSVYVPAYCIEAYKNAEHWKWFTQILPINEPAYKDRWCDTWNVLTIKRDLETWQYNLAHDTIIGDYTYTAVTRHTTKVPAGVYPVMAPEPEYVAAVRFTEDKKAFIYYDNTEYLLYDFNAQPGDELTVFAGINHYHSHRTNRCGIGEVNIFPDSDYYYHREISLNVYPNYNHSGPVPTCFGITKWIEGVGDICGLITGADCGLSDDQSALLCAYKDGNTEYTTEEEEYAEYGCEYNSGENKEYILTLPGLQRTVCNEYCGDTEDDNSANFTYKQTFDSIFFENDKPYILCNGYLLREESNKILLYSQSLNKDIVLYDFTLEVGDSLPAYIKDFDGTMYSDDILVVTDISSVTLLDGKEYKKWTFDNGMEYVEGIGMYGGRRNGNFFGLIQEIVVPCHTGTHLVCVSKNNKLLYQMDDTEMERLGAECLCDYDRGPRKDNAKDGQIGGRPTPTQWNQLELDLREMDNGTTILRAETFSYTLENDSVVANDKIFYQLARQSTKDTATTKSFVGALHFGKDEDNRVYFLRDGVEYVLYDFTAEPGDTVEIFAGINNYPQDSTYTHVVVDKDTTEDGACRMFLEVVFPEETTTAENAEKVWLAGLGSIDGIVHNTATRTSNAHAAPARSAHSSDTQTSVMLCAWREDSCLYITDHPDYNDIGCIYNQDPTSIEDTHSPSPTTDYQKLLRDGQLLIIHKGKTYNVLGVQVK